ncbi:MAG: Wzz/FepE/Etk N-terminal domain-containing protein [Paracraurococcus sp.]
MASQRLLPRIELPRTEPSGAAAALLAAQAPPPSELRAVLRFLRRRWVFILGCGAAMMLAGLAVSLLLPARYSANTSLVVDNRRPRPVMELSTPNDDLGYVDTQILTIQSDLILGAVVRELHLADDPNYGQVRPPLLGRLRMMLSASPDAGPEEEARLREQAALERLRTTSRVRRQGNSFVVDIGVTSRDAGLSARLANAIATAFVEDQRRLGMLATDRAHPASTTRIISPALPPLERAGPGTAVILLGAGLLGLAGGTGIAAIRGALDRRLRSAREVEAAVGLPCLGLVPALPPGLAGSALRYVEEQPDAEATERLRLVRSGIEEWRRGGERLVIGFAGAGEGAGCTVLAANLAILLAEVGHRTLLVDADRIKAGLSRALAPAAGAPSNPVPLRPGAAGGPDFLPLDLTGGPAAPRLPPNWLAGLVEATGSGYDVVLVDLPSPGRSGDFRALTSPLDALVLVGPWGEAEPEDVLEILRLVREPETKELGVILNKAPPRRPGRRA